MSDNTMLVWMVAINGLLLLGFACVVGVCAIYFNSPGILWWLILGLLFRASVSHTNRTGNEKENNDKDKE